MRTLVLVIGGIFVYLLLLLTTQRSDKAAIARISLIFVIGWFLVALGNMIYGIVSQGYALSDEWPIALLIFIVPALPAAFFWFRNRPA